MGGGRGPKNVSRKESQRGYEYFFLWNEDEAAYYSTKGRCIEFGTVDVLSDTPSWAGVGYSPKIKGWTPPEIYFFGEVTVFFEQSPINH